MRKHWKSIMCLWLIGAVLAAGQQGHMGLTAFGNMDTYEVHAANQAKTKAKATAKPTAKPTPEPTIDPELQGQIKEAQSKSEELKQKKKDIEDKMKYFQKHTGNMKNYIKQLDRQMSDLIKEIDANKEEISLAQEELDSVNKELSTATSQMDAQYENMKIRIKYMYENADNSYASYLMESCSLADLFTREEYVEKIMGYDKNILIQYQSVLNEIVVARENASIKVTDLRAKKEDLAYTKKAVQRLVKQKNKQMKKYQGVISNKKNVANSYARQIAAQEAQLENLLAKQRNQDGKSTGGKVIYPTSGVYAWPLAAAGRITSTFGYRSAPTAGASSYHKGLDIAINVGTSVLATRSGKVTIAQYSSSAGNYIAISHGNGVYSYYMHCSSLNVKAGEQVKKGQVIAKSGSTGISTGPHLHFGIFAGGNYVDPLKYVKQK